MKEIQFYTQELRLRSFFLLFSFLSTLLSVYIYSSEYIFFVVQPLGLHHFIFTHISEAFQASVEFSLFLSFIILIPSVLYQFFCFCAPGLFEKERKYYSKILLIFCILSMISAFLSFTIFLPLISQFFVNFEIQKVGMNLQLEARILGSIHFLFQILCISELLCILPLICFLLFEKAILRKNFASKNRKLWYFCLLVLCALICPPEFVLQCIGSGICICVFEIGIFSGYVLELYKDM
jgi:sec-independent protein translocase protein TatC